MSRRHVIMFQPRFAPLVASGAKCQTIRPVRSRPVRHGDVIDARRWRGLPYRSKQKRLVERRALETRVVFLHAGGVEIVGGPLVGVHGVCSKRGKALERFAAADGFKNWAKMRAWFEAAHGLPFVGHLILWRLHA